MPAEQRPQHLAEKLRPTCHVLYFPVLSEPLLLPDRATRTGTLHILWNHRWEYDKRPDLFFEAVLELAEADIPFSISVVGESFDRCPEVFEEAKGKLGDRVRHWGFMESRDRYFELLCEADVVVSTTDHEFLGLSIIEAAARYGLDLDAFLCVFVSAHNQLTRVVVKI
jgi:glycosyltransferase involved in cell wall biosynthesis